MLDNGKHTTNYNTSEELEEVLRNPAITFKEIKTNPHTQEKIYLHSFRNLTLNVNFRLCKVSVSGSLTTFIKGNNYTNLSYSELVEAIDLLSEILKKQPGEIITHRFELAIIIKTPLQPSTYLNHFLTFKKKDFYKQEPPTWSAKPLQTSCSLEQFRIKFYDTVFRHKIPNANLLKYEIVFTRSAKGLAVLKDKSAEALTLAHFVDQNNLELLANFAINTYQSIDMGTIIQPNDYKQLTKKERDLIFAGENPHYWKLQRLTNTNYKKDRKRYLAIKRGLKINSNTSIEDLERRLKDKAKELVYS